MVENGRCALCSHFVGEGGGGTTIVELGPGVTTHRQHNAQFWNVGVVTASRYGSKILSIEVCPAAQRPLFWGEGQGPRTGNVDIDTLHT